MLISSHFEILQSYFVVLVNKFIWFFILFLFDFYRL